MHASAITDTLKTLTPFRASTAGDQKMLRSGEMRATTLTVWEAQLHEEGELNSDNLSLSEFLEGCVATLEPFRDFFGMVRVDGDARLEITCLMYSLHSATVIEPKVLGAIAQAGLALDLEYYYCEPTDGNEG
jgi:hypothetical protein